MKKDMFQKWLFIKMCKYKIILIGEFKKFIDKRINDNFNELYYFFKKSNENMLNLFQ